MKILLIAPLPPPYGGIGNWVDLILRYNKANRLVDIDVLSISPSKRVTEGRSFLWDRIIVQGCCMLKQFCELALLLRKKNHDVIHMTTSGELAIVRDILYLSLAKFFHVPTVYHIRIGRIPSIAKNNTMEWKLLKKALKRAGKVISLDERTAAAIKNNLPAVDVVTLPNPLDDLYKKYLPAVSDEKNEILFTGWVIPTKGVEELLCAWRSIEEMYPSWHLRLIGPCTAEYKESLIKKYPARNVIFSGELKHDVVLQEMAQCSLFVLPSYTEGFPNVILEAMAFQKPILSTSVGAIPEILADECGIVIDKQDTEQLRTAMINLIENPELRAEIGHNGHNKMISSYTISIVFQKYMQIWDELLCAKRNKA